MFTRRLILAIIVALLSLTTWSRAQETGLLLGLRHDSPGSKSGFEQVRDRQSHYRTLWLTLEKGTVALRGERPGLLVPRQTGFWQVGVRRLSEKSWAEDHLWAVPVGKTPHVPEIDPDAVLNSDGFSDLRILFLGPDYAGTEGDTAGYRQMAAHPWAAATLAVYNLERIREGQEVGIADALGVNGGMGLTRGSTDYLSNLSQAQRSLYHDQAVNTDWTLIRRRGHWITRGRLQYANEATRGIFADFDVDAAPPASLIGYDTLSVSWNTLKAKIPDALDAMTSPQKDLLVVLTKTQLRAYRLKSTQIGKLTLTVPLRPGETSVMIQWATGSNVARWTQQLNAAPNAPH